MCLERKRGHHLLVGSASLDIRIPILTRNLAPENRHRPVDVASCTRRGQNRNVIFDTKELPNG